MNEEIEYAEMLEIPISTVNVVRKQRKRKKIEPPQVDDIPSIKEAVIANVNEKMLDATAESTQENHPLTDAVNEEGSIDFDPIPERIDTVRLYTDNPFHGEPPSDDNMQKEGGRYAFNMQPKWLRLTLGIEFGVACALCGAIFLTNIFMPNSAINTFFRALNTPTTETAKPYTDFTLSAVVSGLSDAELTLSPTGILSLTDDCHVYPVADGTVGEVTKNAEGLYTVKVCYSPSFSGVFNGLDTVYYNVGDSVKTNVPLGYTAGNNEVQVTMYSNGALLNCFQLTEENCLAWIPTEENE